MRKKLLIGCVIAMASFNCMPIIAMASTSAVCMEQEVLDVDPRVDKIGYQYKVIDNVLYRRLYNFSTGEVLSDWEVAP
ncbi:hypothetical protein D3Z50_18660 [Clostridiaceae bacterium]|jgi:hypothetical protein|nr:hypothetical protein [Clostridiaceae bacterium]